MHNISNQDTHLYTTTCAQQPSTPFHRAWTSAVLSAHLSTECKCTISQIKTPICTQQLVHNNLSVFLRTTTEVLPSGHITNGMGTLSLCFLVGKHYKTLYFHSRHRHTHSRNGPDQNSMGLA